MDAKSTAGKSAKLEIIEAKIRQTVLDRYLELRKEGLAKTRAATIACFESGISFRNPCAILAWEPGLRAWKKGGKKEKYHVSSMQAAAYDDLQDKIMGIFSQLEKRIRTLEIRAHMG